MSRDFSRRVFQSAIRNRQSRIKMAVRPVLLVPDPRLKQPSAPVEGFDVSLSQLIQDLEDTRRENAGCVGIAACQIGV